MAYEAVESSVPFNSGQVIRFAVSDGTGIEKGTPLVLSGAAVNSTSMVKAASAAGTIEVFAGIAQDEKVASDGSTTIGAATNGVYRMYAGIAMGAGTLVSLSGLFLKPATAGEILSGAVVGKLLEATTTGTQVRVAIGCY